MQYILNETEYWSMKDLMATVESLTDANDELTQKLEISEKVNADYLKDLQSMSHRLEVSESVHKKDLLQINNLSGLVEQGKQSIKERDQRIAALKEAYNLHNKKLAEQAHELLVKEAELADLASKVRSLMKEKQTYCNQIAEMKRDCEGTSRVLKETQEISASRLTSMNNLMQEVRRLRAERVCVAQNPRTGTVRVISASRADIYRQHGWTVSDEYIVDRPA